MNRSPSAETQPRFRISPQKFKWTSPRKLLEKKKDRHTTADIIRRTGLALAVMIAASVAIVVPASAASVTGPSFNQCNGQWWTQDVCKYDQSSTLVVGTTLYVYAKGATASGSCDPSNDVLWVESDGNRIYRTGVAIAGYGGSPQWTNCDIPAGAQWQASRDLDSGTLTIDYFFSYSVGGSIRAAAVEGHWTITP
jgi:hypothetical protein